MKMFGKIFFFLLCGLFSAGQLRAKDKDSVVIQADKIQLDPFELKKGKDTIISIIVRNSSDSESIKLEKNSDEEKHVSLRHEQPEKPFSLVENYDSDIFIPKSGFIIIRVKFAPEKPGEFSAWLRVDPSGGVEEDSVLIIGRAIPPQSEPRAELSPKSQTILFDPVEVSKISPPKEFFLVNDGDAPAVLAMPLTFKMGQHFDFAAPPEASVPPKGNRKFFLQFAPKDTGAHRDTIVIRYRKKQSEQELDSVVVMMAGRGRLPEQKKKFPKFEFTPKSLDFEKVFVGDEKIDSLRLTVSDTTAYNIQLRIDQQLNNFSIISPAKIDSLRAGSDTTIIIRYAPLTPATHFGELKIVSMHGGVQPPTLAQLSGIGAVKPAKFPKLVFDEITQVTKTIDFGVVKSDSDAKEKFFFLKNIGNERARVDAIGVIDKVNFQVDAPAVPFFIQPDDSVKIIVRFLPKGSDLPYSTKLGVEWNAGNQPLRLDLKGLKFLIRAEVRSSEIKFDTTWIDSTPNSRESSIWIVNTGTVKLNLALALTGNNSAFTIASDKNFLLTDSTQIKIVFAPNTEGLATASLQITSLESGSLILRQVQLSGVGKKKTDNPPDKNFFARVRVATSITNDSLGIGEKFFVYVIADSVNRAFADLEKIRCQTSLEFNTTVMTPVRYIDRGEEFSEDKQKISFDSTFDNISAGDTLYAVEMMSLYGNSDSTEIMLGDIIWTKGSTALSGNFQEESGRIFLTGLWSEGGTRLINVSQTQAIISLAPNFVSSDEKIFIAATNFSSGATLKIYNESGMEVADYTDLLSRKFFPLDVDEYSSGIYFCVLSDSGEIIAKPFSVIRR